MSSKVKIIPKNELLSMATGTLEIRRTNLLKCEESFESSDRFGYEEPPEPDKTGFIEFKDQPSWSTCLLYTSPSPRDGLLSRMPSSA